MSKKPLTITQFFKQFPTDESCLQHLFEVRFGQGYACPKCERPSNWYRIKAERAYSCQWCGHHLHPTVGTPFEKTRTPLQLWFYAIFMFTTTRNGVAAKELQRQLGVTYKTAWRMGHEIRKHMGDVDGEEPVGGEGMVVEVDETLVGGVSTTGKKGRNLENKTFVLGMLERGGNVVTAVVPDCKRASLWPVIEGNVVKGSTLNTDELKSYFGISLRGYRHQTVNHRAGEYVSTYGCTTNGIEGFWAILQRGIAGTHITSAVSTSRNMPRNLSTASIVAATAR
jgi:transposase